MAEFEKTEVGEIKTTVKVEDPKFTKKALISSKKFTPIRGMFGTLKRALS